MVPWTLIHTLVAVPLYARERLYVQTASYFFCFFVAWCGKMSEFLQMTSGTNELVGKSAVLAKETMARRH